MWLVDALIAAFLTSFLPIINKRLLADTPVSVVAWGVNALSLPLLGVAAVMPSPLPRVDAVFWLAVVGSAVLNLVATLLSTWALKLGEASLVTPVLTFNPAFTLLVAGITLKEMPTDAGIAGVMVILAGGYVLNVQEIGSGWWRPFSALVSRPAMLLAILASLVWGLTPIVEKVAIENSRPTNPPLVAFGSTALMAVFLLPLMWRQTKRPLEHLGAHRRGFVLAACIAGIAPVFGFTAISLGLVGYVSAIFKLSTVFSVVWAVALLGEGASWERLFGSGLMVLGAILIGV
jgi:drug/metabolite transporter (DMT)-like permease